MRDDSGIGRGEGRLHEEGEEELIADVLDLVDKGGHDPASKNSRDIGRDGDVADLDNIVRKHEQRALVAESDHCLPDHAANEEDDKIYGELAVHAEELEGKEWPLGNGEIVNEGSDDDASTDRDSSRDKGHRSVGRAEESDSNQEDGETGCEEEQPNVVELLDLLPTRLLVVVLRAGRREVTDERANQTDDSVDDCDVVTPPPGCLEIKLCANESTERTPGDGNAEFCPAKANTSVR